jgi:hypothetical protein
MPGICTFIRILRSKGRTALISAEQPAYAMHQPSCPIAVHHDQVSRSKPSPARSGTRISNAGCQCRMTDIRSKALDHDPHDRVALRVWVLVYGCRIFFGLGRLLLSLSAILGGTARTQVDRPVKFEAAMDVRTAGMEANPAGTKMLVLLYASELIVVNELRFICKVRQLLRRKKLPFAQIRPLHVKLVASASFVVHGTSRSSESTVPQPVRPFAIVPARSFLMQHSYFPKGAFCVDGF